MPSYKVRLTRRRIDFQSCVVFVDAADREEAADRAWDEDQDWDSDDYDADQHDIDYIEELG